MVASKYAKRDMMESEFTQRASQITPHGLGLSVDVYSPDVILLAQRLHNEGLQPGYMEIFKATTSALQWVRRRLPALKLTYHGEGLWVTQPEFLQSGSGRQGLAEACAHIAALGSAWLNHECATKHMAGYAFGTYLPPLYTALSASMTAENLVYVQGQLDEQARRYEKPPTLVLLEMPPLTYFACGVLGIPAFFQAVTKQVACGLVLDMGHLWTVYRYTGAWHRQPLTTFVAEFLDAFPMERVIEIHVAGLAEFTRYHVPEVHAGGSSLPYWIDSHGAPIPEVLFDLLTQVLSHPRLTSLKGVALEVDTKPIAEVVTEFRRFVEQFQSKVPCSEQIACHDSPQREWREHVPGQAKRNVLTSDERAVLHRQYQAYVELVTTPERMPMIAELSLLGGSLDDLNRYRDSYLPHELLHWGGELTDMFPRTCVLLAAANIPLAQFIPFWFDKPRPEQDDYDFFLLKIDRFVEFVAGRCPAAGATVTEEAEELRTAYRAANEPIGSDEVHA
ncbi:MAG: multinuclear nonheme iron-dependent oxidase [Nitrospira sp.]